MFSSVEYARLLAERGFNFFTGVPCSLITGLLRELTDNPRYAYYPAVREDAAIGLGVGAYLGGKRPVVLMQNSGLGTALNALTSLAILYEIPLLLIVTYRGEGCEDAARRAHLDAPEHWLSGAITDPLLEMCTIQHSLLDPRDPATHLDTLLDKWDAAPTPRAILVSKGALSP